MYIACGYKHAINKIRRAGSEAKASDFIVAVSHLQFLPHVSYKETELVLVNPTNGRWMRAQILQAHVDA
jgi:hypothetical protein